MIRLFRFALAALLCVALPAASSAPIVVLKDRQMHSAGPSTFYVNPWNSNALAASSYSNEITIESDKDPLRFTISHRYSTGFKNGVRGYPAVEIGAGRGAKPLTPWPARLTSKMSGVEQQFDLTVARKSGDFNILAETFAVASETDNSAGLMEIGWQLWVNKPLSDWLYHSVGKQKGKFLGVFIDRSGVGWSATLMPSTDAAHPPYLNMLPSRSALAGTLYWGDLFDWLIAKKLLSGKEVIRGTFFGVEPVSGEATVKVNKLTVPARIERIGASFAGIDSSRPRGSSLDSLFLTCSPVPDGTAIRRDNDQPGAARAPRGAANLSNRRCRHDRGAARLARAAPLWRGSGGAERFLGRGEQSVS